MAVKAKGKTVWVMTFKSPQDYDQHGQYFVKVFGEKPDMVKAATALSDAGVTSGDFMSAVALVQSFLDGKAVGSPWAYQLEEVELS